MSVAVRTSHLIYNFLTMLAINFVVGFLSYNIETPLSPEWTAASGFMLSASIQLYFFYKRLKRLFTES